MTTGNSEEDQPPIPAALFLESGRDLRERELLWERFEALLEKVAREGVDSLELEDFCLYILLAPLFRTGCVVIAPYRGVIMTKRGRSDEVTNAITAACRFIMRPAGNGPSVDDLIVMFRQSVADREANDAAQAPDTPATTDPGGTNPNPE